MDDLHFDALTRSLTSPETRRRVLTGLASLPVLGGLLGILGVDETEAGRRKRRKKRHKHGKGRRRTHRRGKGKGKPAACTPDSVPQTCANACGSVTNNCGERIDCGSCACEPKCGICLTCDDQTGECVPDPVQEGKFCEQHHKICLPDGQCACTPEVCGPCSTCGDDGACTPRCDGVGCCDGVSCQVGDDVLACGANGRTCVECFSGEQCVAGACTCKPDCTGKLCGDDDGCGGVCQTESCGPCQSCQAGECVEVADGTACDTGDLCVEAASCLAGECTALALVNCPAPENPCMWSICNPANGNCVESPANEGYPCDVAGLCLQVHSTCDGRGACIETWMRCQDSMDNCCLHGEFIGQCKRTGGAPCTVDIQCCSNSCPDHEWCA